MNVPDNREDTWLVFADWLEEAGHDTSELRAEIVREKISSWFNEYRSNGVGGGVSSVGGGGVSSVSSVGSVGIGVVGSGGGIGVVGGVGLTIN